MSHNYGLNSSFHLSLIKLDKLLFEEQRAQDCTFCGGPLHQANYPRSPFGVPLEHREHYEERFSLCCGHCRRRNTSPSVRFFGRRWFVAPLIILISSLLHGPSYKGCEQLNRLFGIRISTKTWKRWQRWWQDIFRATHFWISKTGIVPIAQLNGPFPRIFLLGGADTLQKRLVTVLSFLAPMTAGVLRAV